MKIRKPDFTILDDYFQAGKLLEQIERCGRVCYKSEDKITEESAVPFIKGIIKRGHESVLEMGQIVCRIKGGSSTALTEFFEYIPRFCQVDRTERDEFIFSGNPRAFRDLSKNFTENLVVQTINTTLAQKWPLLFQEYNNGPEMTSQPSVHILSAQEIEYLPVSLLKKHRTILAHITVNRAVTHELVRHRIASYLQESQRYCRYGEDRFGGEVVFIAPCFFDEDSEEFTLWKKAMEETENIYLQLLKTSSPQAARTVLPNSCKTEIMVHATLEEWLHILRLRTSTAADPSMREIMTMMLPVFTAKYPEIFSELTTSTSYDL